jgi:hypothetical protein
LIGPQGRSAEIVKTFLDEVGPHWIPVELNVFEVLQREARGANPSESCVAEEFMRAYFRNRTAGYVRDSGKIIDLSTNFFSLGKVLDWVGPERDSIRKTSEEFDSVLKTEILRKRLEYDRDPSRLIPPQPFNPARRATFVCANVVRTLILEAKAHPLKKGDALDFSHSVMASAFASLATLPEFIPHQNSTGWSWTSNR